MQFSYKSHKTLSHPLVNSRYWCGLVPSEVAVILVVLVVLLAVVVICWGLSSLWKKKLAVMLNDE